MINNGLKTLITSAAYIGEEMQAEFGRMPPAFLPIGSAYLVQHQLRNLQDRHLKFISLPTDFQLSEPQSGLLQNENVSVVRINPKRSLGMSIFQAIIEIGPGGPLEIFHGDTLVLSPPLPKADAVSIDTVKDEYKWGLVSTSVDQVSGIHDPGASEQLTEYSELLSGYFFFEDTWELLRCITRHDFNFIYAVNNYARIRKLVALREIEALDCGHLKTFYESRRRLATTRHFNSLVINDYLVCKRSSDHRKMAAEANWLRSIPSDLQPFSVRLIEAITEHSLGEYRTLYSSYPTLSELYLARSSSMLWSKVLDSCREFLTRAFQHKVLDELSPFKWLVIGKLRERIRAYPDYLPSFREPLRINGYSVGTLESIVDHLEAVVSAAPELPRCVMHGDFCFSNILFDLRADRIQLIDPRGLIGDEMTILGDVRYDIAKLAHSVLGRYDQIMAENLRAYDKGVDFILEIPQDPSRDRLEKMFLEAQIGDISFAALEIKAAMVSLFLSMIPLHKEDAARQKTLFANGLRLFATNFL